MCKQEFKGLQEFITTKMPDVVITFDKNDIMVVKSPLNHVVLIKRKNGKVSISFKNMQTMSISFRDRMDGIIKEYYNINSVKKTVSKVTISIFILLSIVAITLIGYGLYNKSQVVLLFNNLTKYFL